MYSDSLLIVVSDSSWKILINNFLGREMKHLSHLRRFLKNTEIIKIKLPYLIPKKTVSYVLYCTIIDIKKVTFLIIVKKKKYVEDVKYTD